MVFDSGSCGASRYAPSARMKATKARVRTKSLRIFIVVPFFAIAAAWVFWIAAVWVAKARPKFSLVVAVLVGRIFGHGVELVEVAAHGATLTNKS